MTSTPNLQLKECQYEAVKALVVDRKDTFCILPTGYGKPLIYQLLPFVLDVYLDQKRSSIIIISPLNVLMIDQISKLKSHMEVSVLKANRRAKSNTNSTEPEKGSIYDQISRPSQIIFAHPEALLEDTKIFHILIFGNYLFLILIKSYQTYCIQLIQKRLSFKNLNP